ncbi:MAG: ABC transporter permease [Vicinamibacterales bacterium]
MRVLAAVASDLRAAFRQLRVTPMVTAVAVLSLALGIGANVAIFSLVNALMLKRLPVHEPDRLVLVGMPLRGGEGLRRSFTNPQWEYLRDHTDVFAGMAAVGGARFDLNAGGEARPIEGVYVNGRFFDTLGVVPAAGRLLTEADDQRGGGQDGPVAVLSYGFWQREFGGSPDVLGRTLPLDGHAFTIVGVAPEDFLGVEVGQAFDVAVPLATEAVIQGELSSLDQRSSWWIRILGRLAPGQTLAQAQARLEAGRPGLVTATMPQDWRVEDQARYLAEPFVLSPAGAGFSYLRERYSRPLFVLLGIVALVLLIACANLANLLLARSTARRRELSIRVALGASRSRLARLLIVESLLLSALGTAAGILVAVWGSRALVGLISTYAEAVVLDLALDWRVLAFTAAVGTATGLLFGAVPALRSTRVMPADALRDHSRGVIGGGRLGLVHGLVALQVALSFVLVFGAGLFVRTFASLTTQDMGFDASRVLIATVDLRRAQAESPDLPARFERLRDALLAVPGVESSAVSVVTPVSRNTWNDLITVPGYDAPEDDRIAWYNRVTPGYFRTYGTPVLTGRDIGAGDRLGAPNVVLVNETFAGKFFGGASPLGKTFTIGTGERAREVQIVGLVADAKYDSLREPAQPTMYAAWAQYDEGLPRARISVRTRMAPETMRAAVVEALAREDPAAVISLKAFADDLAADVTQERAVALLSGFFGLLALLLAAVGLYGVMSYSVVRRRNEIGIRIALGANPGRLLRQVLAQVALITVIGLGTGVAVALGAGRVVESLLFGLGATDWSTVALAGVALAGAAVLAGYLPARRAAGVDPMQALREE